MKFHDKRPQQLGVGVSGRFELYGIGFKVRFEEAICNGVKKGLIKPTFKTLTILSRSQRRRSKEDH
jgi:hypothetical protein